MTEESPRSSPSLKIGAIVFSVLVLAILAGGYGWYRGEAKRILQEKYADIAAISEMKVEQIVQWKTERLADVRRAARAGLVVKDLEEFVRNPDAADLRNELRRNLVTDRKEDMYANVFLIAPDGKLLLAAQDEPNPLCPVMQQTCAAALASGEPVLSDFFCHSEGIVHIDAACVAKDAGGRPLAVMILRSNDKTQLSPLIRSWPTRSRSAETLLVQRKGEEVVLLNELRPDSNRAPRRIPLAQVDSPSVQAVLGKQGIFQGKDYRGVEVLADLRPIPGSPWFLVTKADAHEILAERRYRTGSTVVVAVLFVLLAGATVAFVYREQQQTVLFQRLYQSERQKREAECAVQTAEYAAQQALRESEKELRVQKERLEKASFAGKVALWDWDMGTGALEWSSVVDGMLGFGAGGFPRTILAREDIIHPDDKAQVMEVLNRHLKSGAPYETSYRVRRNDGAYVWWHDVGTAARDEHGEAVRMSGACVDITGRQQAEEAIRLAKQDWEIAFDAVSDAIMILDADHQVRRVNGALARLLGRDPQDFVGRKCYELVHGTSEPPPFCPHALLLKDAQEHTVEFHEERLGRDLLVNVSPLRDNEGRLVGAVHVARDITARKRMEEAGRERERRFCALVENAPDCVSLLGPDGRFIYASPAAARINGYSQEEFLQKNAFQIIHPEDLPGVEQAFQRILKDPGPRISLEFRLQHRDGSWRWIDAIAANRLEDPALRGVVVNYRDITEHKFAKELTRSNKELEQFASIASHDLQEPLRMITGFVELLKQDYQDKLDDKAKEYISFAVDGARRMSVLIKALLAYSRAGGADLILAPANIEAVLGTVLTNMKMSIRESGTVVTHDPLPTVVADAGQIIQVIQNIIGNAIKFRSSGQPCQVHVSAKAEGKEWLFSIRDNGIGIDPLFKDRIFVIFERLRAREEHDGSGIGLAICMKIVERHGGRIWVESAPGAGSTFYFALPGSLEMEA